MDFIIFVISATLLISTLMAGISSFHFCLVMSRDSVKYDELIDMLKEYMKNVLNRNKERI